MSYNIDKNTRLYYIWTIRYDKYLCKWSSLLSSTSTTRGGSKWVSTSSYRFLVLTYHNNIGNDASQPTLPSDLNYPGYPSSSYCEMQYIQWRVVKSSLYTGEPFQTAYVSTVGDDLWRQITPYEYEMIQSVPMFCATSPQPPSFTNTVLKYDSADTYRKFTSRWCHNSVGIPTYVSGPVYAGNVKERGGNRWEYKGKNYADSLLGIVYEIEWVSSIAGIGTSPQSIISDELFIEMTSWYTGSPATSTRISLSPIASTLTPSISIEQTFSGYPIYRVEYDCMTKSYGAVELIALDQDVNQKRSNSWEYVDIHSASGKCIFYYYSSALQLRKTYNEAAALTKPSSSSVKLYDCPCGWLVDIDKVLTATEFITVMLSGVEGKGNIANAVYKLPKIYGEYTWKYKVENIDISLEYDSGSWDFSFYRTYEDNNSVRINKVIETGESFVGNFRVAFCDGAEFTDEDGTATCLLSFQGNTLEPYVAPAGETEESSSSSSEQGEILNIGAIQTTGTQTTQEISINREDYYGPEQGNTTPL